MNSTVLSRIIALSAAASALSVFDRKAAGRINDDLRALLRTIGFDDVKVIADAMAEVDGVADGSASWLEFYRREDIT